MKIVYFMKPLGMVGPIKIGSSIRPEKRLRDVEIWSPIRLEIVATAPGSCTHERLLHHRFAKHRLHGEWFNAVPELIELVRSIAETGALPVLAVPEGYAAWKELAENAKGKMPRRNNASRLYKYRLTKRVQDEETRVFGFSFRKDNRPSEIEAIIQGYQGFAASLPTEEEVAILDAYVADLKGMPTADRSLRAFRHQFLPDAGEPTTAREGMAA